MGKNYKPLGLNGLFCVCVLVISATHFIHVFSSSRVFTVLGFLLVILLTSLLYSTGVELKSPIEHSREVKMLRWPTKKINAVKCPKEKKTWMCVYLKHVHTVTCNLTFHTLMVFPFNIVNLLLESVTYLGSSLVTASLGCYQKTSSMIALCGTEIQNYKWSVYMYCCVVISSTLTVQYMWYKTATSLIHCTNALVCRLQLIYRNICFLMATEHSNCWTSYLWYVLYLLSFTN